MSTQIMSHVYQEVDVTISLDAIVDSEIQGTFPDCESVSDGFSDAGSEDSLISSPAMPNSTNEVIVPLQAVAVTVSSSSSQNSTLENCGPDTPQFVSRYPMGARIFYSSFYKNHPANYEIVEAVKDCFNAVKAGDLTYDQLEELFAMNLTPVQREIAYVHLIEDVQFHEVLIRVEGMRAETAVCLQRLRLLIGGTIEHTSTPAILGRTLFSTAGDVLYAGATHGSSAFTATGSLTIATVNGVASALMFGFFCGLEIYRWSRRVDPISTSTLVKNIGEHFVGCGLGAAGAIGGAIAGMTLGSIVPGIGTAIGGLLGTVIGSLLGSLVAEGGGRWVYRCAVPGTKKVRVPVAIKQIVVKAAEKFGIDVDDHSYEQAHRRFRNKLCANHPDKFPHASDEERARLNAETIEILACWTLVRNYYDGQDAIKLEQFQGEGYLQVCVKKVRDTAAEAWRVVDSWLGEPCDGNVIPSDTETVEVITLYV